MQIIVNADDFGRSASVNAAVMQAHRDGVLTSASLMVTGDAYEEAVALARDTPTLAVGLHLVVIDQRSVLPPGEIPHLVNRDGYFRSEPVSAGLVYFFSRAARRELARELSAQFHRFGATGLPLSHVDGHWHMHMHPTVLSQILPLAEEYGAGGIRLPRDDVWLGLRHDRQRAGSKMAWALAFALLSRWASRKLRHRHLDAVDRVYGLMQSGDMQESYVIGLLRGVTVRTAELYFHPSLTAEDGVLGPNPVDLATLVSPAVRRVIRERDMQLATYPTLERMRGR